MSEEERRKREDVQGRYEKLYAEAEARSKHCQECDSRLIVLEESGKSLEYKLDHCKKELRLVKQQYEASEQQVGSLKAKVEYLDGEKTRLSEELRLASDKLSITIKAKNTADFTGEELARELTRIKEQLTTKEESLTAQRSEFERVRTRLAELERETDLGETKRKSSEKEHDIARKNLAEKVHALEDRLKTELEARGSLTAQQHLEERAHSDTKTRLLRTASELEDVKLKLQNKENELANKERSVKELVEERVKLQEQIAKAEVDKDSLRLDKEKGDELLKKLEEFYKSKLVAKKEKRMRILDAQHTVQEQFQLCYEDLHTHCAELYASLSNSVSKV